MLERILDLFKENSLLGLACAAVIAGYTWLFKSDAAVPSLWRTFGTATTILSMIVGIYWIPAQSQWYWALGMAIVATSSLLTTQGITYSTGSGLATKEVTLATTVRIFAFLPAVWAPLILPALQWFLHISIPDVVQAPRSAYPMLESHRWRSLFNCSAISTILAASAFLLDRFYIPMRRTNKD
jgi:hypothetical protein